MRRIAEARQAERLGATPGSLAVGDYLHSDRDLYRVEQVGEGNVLIEDCRTGALIDVPTREIAALSRLERA